VNIKAVIFHHNQPDNADRLYEQLATVFDTELWDSGSPPHRIPCHLTHPFPNFYGTGAWNHMMAHYSDYDAVWLICADVTLQNDSKEYLQAITSALPFGIWSPCIQGRAHPFMLSENYGDRQPYTVRNVESQAMALSGPLMKEVKRLIDGSPYGFGHDYWLCYRSRKAGMRNIIDGRVCVYHPPGTGYDEQKAHEAMDQAFGGLYGSNYRQTIFEYAPSFQGNLHGKYKPLTYQREEHPRMPQTIFTIDNGWGLQEFTEIIANFPDCKKVLMKKGVSPLTTVTGVEVIAYNPDLSGFADGNHLGLFPRLGPANFEDYKKILALGVPCVVNANYQRDTIVHEKTGHIYGNTHWAVAWLRALIADENLRTAIHNNLLQKAVSVKPAPLVTIITPTFRRDPKVITRCINCLQLQTVTEWEMLLCSDGGSEKHVTELLDQLKEPRISYAFLPKSEKPDDYGNTIRGEMLKRATGKYVLFCDDDNLILPDYLAKMANALEKSGADFAVCRVVHFGPFNEAVTGKPPKVLTGFPVKLYHVDPLQVLVKREAMQAIGWDCEHGYVSDGVTLEKLGAKYKATEVPEVLGFHM
jgi:hypothetical protein